MVQHLSQNIAKAKEMVVRTERSSSKCTVKWLIDAQGPFYNHGLTLTPVWISNHMSSEVWDEITYSFPNFNGCTIEIWELIRNVIPHYIMDVITYPCKD